jgi:hypothetical protein
MKARSAPPRAAGLLSGLLCCPLWFIPDPGRAEEPPLDSEMHFRIVEDLAPTDWASDSTADHTKLRNSKAPFSRARRSPRPASPAIPRPASTS